MNLPQTPVRQLARYSRTVKILTVALISLFSLCLMLSVPWVVRTQRLCTLCHEMRPYYYTLQVSSHSKFNCVDCHWRWEVSLLKSDKAFSVNKLKDMASPMLQVGREIATHFFKEQKFPIFGRNPPQDTVCLECHSLKREVTPGGDLIIPHAQHRDKRVRCVACHAEVVHGQLASTKKAESIDSGQLQDPAFIQKTVHPNSTGPPMSMCMTCHKRRNVTLECTACHKELKMPEAHMARDFRQNHGREALKDPAVCDKCHKYSMKSDVQERGILGSAISYARANPFCSNCHGNMPENHLVPNWMFIHGRTGQEISTCATCHPLNPGDRTASARTNCIKCHYQSHRGGWRNRHPVDVGQSINPSCFSCHTEPTCRSCHAS